VVKQVGVKLRGRPRQKSGDEVVTVPVIGFKNRPRLRPE
jgi:hypothetical protein